MTAVVIQHVAKEGAGILGSILEHHGIRVRVVEVYRDGKLPPLVDSDLMLVMGGPQQIWETDRHPWLLSEIAAIRHWVETLRRPYFGVCLGHQLLAAALGGEVSRATVHELGFPQVTTLPGATADPLFAAIPSKTHWLQWHEAEVTRLPTGVTVMARSVDCAVQAMSIGHKVVSLQFHAEASDELVRSWTSAPDIVSDMTELDGPDAHNRLRDQARVHLNPAKRNATRLFETWLRLNGCIS